MEVTIHGKATSTSSIYCNNYKDLVLVTFQAHPVAITAFYLQANNAPYCYVLEQKPSEVKVEKVTKTTELENRKSHTWFLTY